MSTGLLDITYFDNIKATFILNIIYTTYVSYLFIQYTFSLEML